MWAGKPEELLDELKKRQAQIGEPDAADNDSSSRQLLADAIRYVTNQKTRMRYSQYRRDGLPITSAYIESTIQ